MVSVTTVMRSQMIPTSGPTAMATVMAITRMWIQMEMASQIVLSAPQKWQTDYVHFLTQFRAT